jgi:hypothetical protein
MKIVTIFDIIGTCTTAAPNPAAIPQTSDNGKLETENGKLKIGCNTETRAHSF